MRASRLMAFALTISMMMVAMIVAGCTTTGTPTPAPSATPTPAPTPTLSPVDKEYQYVEQLQAGVEQYNSALEIMMTGKNLSNASDYANASRYMQEAGERMDTAATQFLAMSQFASTPQEQNLSQLWADTANYSKMSYDNASLAYTEYASEMARPEQSRNLVKYNYYVEQANTNNQLAAESRRQVDELMSNMTFMTPTLTPADMA